MTPVGALPCFLEMAAMFKRLAILSLVLAFGVGVSARLMPCEIDQPVAATPVAAQGAEDMAGGCPKPEIPCKPLTPSCIDHLGCLSVAAVPPPSPTSPPIVFEWRSVAYRFSTAPLAGLSVKPELSPPIRAA
jgi:hypothetical protein